MSIDKLYISIEEKSALVEIQKNFITDFQVEELVVFGSGVKNEAVEGTAPDLLALTEKPVTSQQKQAMMEMVAKINSSYRTSITVLIFDRATWEVWAGQTLYQEVKRDGMQIW